jgi:hypothetical protein
MLSTDAGDMSRTLTSFGGKQYKFMAIIGQFVNKLNFSPQDVDYTYIFEFIHEASYVLTKYAPEQYGLYLIGARRLSTHKEATEQELDGIAQRIGVRRPRRWDVMASHEEIQAMMKQMAQEVKNFEGFVFRDRDTGERVKVKDPDYVRKHHMVDDVRSIKTLLPIILNGEEDEVIAYHPHAAPRVKEIKDAYEKYLNKVVSKVMEWQAKGLKGRELAVALFGENPFQKWQLRLMKQRGEKLPELKSVEPDEFVSKMITDIIDKYKLTDGSEIRAKVDESMKAVVLGDGHNVGSAQRLMDIIGLRDKEEDVPEDIGEI